MALALLREPKVKKSSSELKLTKNLIPNLKTFKKSFDKAPDCVLTSKIEKGFANIRQSKKKLGCFKKQNAPPEIEKSSHF